MHLKIIKVKLSEKSRKKNGENVSFTPNAIESQIIPEKYKNKLIFQNERIK